MIGIAGPVFGGTLSYMHNIRHWCPLREVDIVRDTSLKRVALLNDFVANGYGAIELSPEEVTPIYTPS